MQITEGFFVSLLSRMGLLNTLRFVLLVLIQFSHSFYCESQNPTIVFEQPINFSQGGGIPELGAGDWFGYDMSPIGDLNGDGVYDIAVGSIYDDDGGVDRGSVYILFMTNAGTVGSYQKISSTQGGFQGVLVDESYFGSSIANLGDMNGDGVQDLVVGATGDDDGGSYAGAIWVLFMNSDGTVNGFQKISALAGSFNANIEAVDRFGIGLDSIGDLNNDGVNDIVVGASEDDDAGLNKGAIYILYLNSDGTVQSFAKIHEGTPGFMGDLTGEALFGWAVSYMGDVNGDGNIEILVGAQRDNVSGSEEGSVWVVSINNTGGIVQTTEISVATSAALAGVVTPGSRFGSSVTLVHDLWCDNSPDIAVGLQAFGANDEGAVFLIDLDANFNAQGVLVIAEGLAGLQATLDPLDRFGWGLDVMYDYNGDGFSELMVGSVNFDDGGTNIGGTWLLSLNPSSSESVLLDSTWFCSDNEISLFPESPVQNILWSTGETTDTIMVSTTGPIWVSGTIGGCIMTDTTVVIFDDVQLPELSDTAVCGELILEVLYPNYDVIWSTGETSEQIQITQSGTYSVSLVGQCGTLSTEFTVSVATETFADFLTRSKPIEFLDPNVQFVNESNGATTYEWHFGDGQVSFEENPEHVYDESGVYLVMLVAYGTDGLECVDTTYGYVSVDPMFTFYVPNAFTPDGDGINDTWGGVGLNFEYESFELEIFDRWGGLMWQTDNPFKGWDGTHMKSGNRVKQGMYVYQFRLRQFDTFEPKVFKGTVTLYRHN